MSDARRPTSGRSRQELLDEIYLLRDVAGEREQQCIALRAELAESERVVADQRQRIADAEAELGNIYASRSWRLTSPLRALARLRRGRKARVNPSMPPGPALIDGAIPSVVVAVPSTTAQPACGQACMRRTDIRCLFVDVTELSLHEGRTGVQRVVREILRALLASPPEGFTVEPVIAPPGQPYGYAGPLAVPFEKHDTAPTSAVPIDTRAGDVFLGLDHSMQPVIDHADAFEQMRARGVQVWFVCNDTLPLAHPEWFPPEVHGTFKQWFETIATVGDGIACISRATENDVRQWIDALGIRRAQPLTVGCFHLGADIGRSKTPVALTHEEQADVDRLRGRPSFLMVGTLEPRKGHAQALEAFNQSWANGNDVALVIVGLPGWMTEVTQRRIRHHDEFGKRLFWYMGVSDAMLERLYASCTALLAPSEGEGFGLPLIEAARRGLPILCRDLPVFHEVAGRHATYFSGLDVDSLADALQGWLSAHGRNTVPVSGSIRWLTWEESARQLLNIMLHDHVGSSGLGGP